MAKIAERFNIGDRDNITLERLLVLMEEMYMDIAEALNKKPDIYVRDTVGQASDTFLSIGDINIKDNNVDPIIIEMLVQHTSPTTVVWKEI